MLKLFMASLGCAKNMVEAEIMLGETLDEHFVLELDPAEADVIIINTCGFIEEARQEAREVIGEYIAVKEQSPRKVKVVAAGCWAERAPDDVLREFPQLDAVWGLKTASSLREAINRLKSDPAGTVSGLGKPLKPREGARLLTTLPSFAYLKISDGCDNLCHYCAIPLIRGGLRSRAPQAIIDEAKSLEDQNVKELVVIAQDTTAYGQDLRQTGVGLANLLESLLKTTAIPRIRLLYAHPAHLDDRVIALLLSEPRLCNYVDLPLQHVSTVVLSAMGRGYDQERIAYLLNRFDKRLILRTTFLTGFPGETEADFLQMLDMVKQGWFKHMGAFSYSPERDTPAAILENRVPPDEAARRRGALLEAQRRVAFSWLDGRIGTTEDILVDSRLDRDWFLGRSVSEAPDADGSVFLRGGGGHPGKIVKACIKARDGYDLIAETAKRETGNRRHRRKH